MAFDIVPQIVYVLTNPGMPGLVKIGKTSQAEVGDRMRQLYSTGVRQSIYPLIRHLPALVDYDMSAHKRTLA